MVSTSCRNADDSTQTGQEGSIYPIPSIQRVTDRRGNDTVRGKMMEELSKENKDQFLKWHWYVAKDQKAPLRFEKQSRNCHVKFLQVDGQVAIMGIYSP
jgi:hypothetical protein